MFIIVFTIMLLPCTGPLLPILSRSSTSAAAAAVAFAAAVMGSGRSSKSNFACVLATGCCTFLTAACPFGLAPRRLPILPPPPRLFLLPPLLPCPLLLLCHPRKQPAPRSPSPPSSPPPLSHCGAAPAPLLPALPALRTEPPPAPTSPHSFTPLLPSLIEVALFIGSSAGRGSGVELDRLADEGPWAPLSPPPAPPLVNAPARAAVNPLASGGRPGGPGEAWPLAAVLPAPRGPTAPRGTLPLRWALGPASALLRVPPGSLADTGCWLLVSPGVSPLELGAARRPCAGPPPPDPVMPSHVWPVGMGRVPLLLLLLLLLVWRAAESSRGVLVGVGVVGTLLLLNPHVQLVRSRP